MTKGYDDLLAENKRLREAFELIESDILGKMESIVGRYDRYTAFEDRPMSKIQRNRVRKECIEIMKYRYKEAIK